MHRTGTPVAREARRSGLPWLLIAVASIVLGLLGGHAFTGAEPAGHSAATAALSARTATAHSAHALEATVGGRSDDGAGAGIAARAEQPAQTGDALSGTGHLDLAAVCMLALLFTVVVLLRALPASAVRTRERTPLVLRPAVGRLAGRPRPSLVNLGISRT